MTSKIKAKIGDRILFKRKEKTVIGIVEIVRDNSVIVEVPSETAMNLHYETPKTVVRHLNYVVIEEDVIA